MWIAIAAALLLGAGGALAFAYRRHRLSLPPPPPLPPRADPDAALAAFVERVAQAGSIEEVAAAAAFELDHVAGIPGVILLRSVGGFWTAERVGGGALEPPPPTTHNVFAWLARNSEPVFI